MKANNTSIETALWLAFSIEYVNAFSLVSLAETWEAYSDAKGLALNISYYAEQCTYKMEQDGVTLESDAWDALTAEIERYANIWVSLYLNASSWSNRPEWLANSVRAALDNTTKPEPTNPDNTPSTMNANEINALELLERLPATAVRVAAALLPAKYFDEYFTPETANVEYLRSMLEDAITEHGITAAQLNEAASRRPRIFKSSHAAICPLDFDTVYDAYNYAMAHRHDESPLAVAIPIDAHGTDYGRSLALNGVKLFAVWSDELEETANGYIYTTEAGAREAMAQVEANDKEAGVYEPNYWKVSDMTKYFA